MKLFFFLFLLSWNIAPMYAQDVKLPPFDAVPFGNVYGQEFPRVNPSYCQGFNIDYPIVPGLAFEIGSTQEIHWSFNKSVAFPSDYLVRIRLMNSTQHFHYIIQGFSQLTSGDHENKGSVSFPLKVVGSSGTYHYRVVVHAQNQTVHCVYESVPFTLLGNPYKNQVIAGAPYPYVNEDGTYLTASTPDFGMKYPLGS